jgi:hypothetical protein
MKTKHSPSTIMAARGGHPSPAAGAAPKRNLRGTILLAAAIALALPACTSRNRDAFFAALPEWPGQWPAAGHTMSQSAASFRMDP